MRFFGLSQEELDHEFERFRQGDATNKVELTTRHLIIVSCGIGLWFATAQVVMLVWGFGYVALNSAYVHFLRQASEPTPYLKLIIAMLGSLTVAAWYCAMVIYIATLNEGDFVLLASIGCIGLALHCIARNDEFTYSAIVDFLATLVTSGCVLVLASLAITSFWTGIATLVGGVCVIFYFGLSFREILQQRRQLGEKMKAEVQGEKMRALGQLTSGIAHDFNNLLTVVNGNIELARVDPEGAEAHGYLEEAHSAGLKGAALTRQLLAFSRKSQFQVVEVEISELSDRLQSILHSVLPAHITLKVGPVDAEARVIGDAAMLESAILNLVINARDAIGDKPGNIAVSIDTASQAGMVKICVEDDGPGLDDLTLAKATEPFFTTKDVGEGSGLGLPMAKGVAEQSGGSFEIARLDHGGIIASMSLPRIDIQLN